MSAEGEAPEDDSMDDEGIYDDLPKPPPKRKSTQHQPLNREEEEEEEGVAHMTTTRKSASSTHKSLSRSDEANNSDVDTDKRSSRLQQSRYPGLDVEEQEYAHSLPNSTTIRHTSEVSLYKYPFHILIDSIYIAGPGRNTPSS